MKTITPPLADSIVIKSQSENNDEIIISSPKEYVASDSKYKTLSTKYKNCPECGGSVLSSDFRKDKGLMTVYGESGVYHVIHRESRCQDCRLGLYYGYKVGKKGEKVMMMIV